MSTAYPPHHHRGMCHMKVIRTAALGAAGLLVLAACGSSGGGGSSDTGVKTTDTVQLSQGGDVKIEVVTHGQASDPFWSVVKNGIAAAAKAEGVTANYSAPDTFDMVKMSQLIDAAVAKKPNGLVVSMPDYDALKDSLKKATDAG